MEECKVRIQEEPQDDFIDVETPNASQKDTTKDNKPIAKPPTFVFSNENCWYAFDRILCVNFASNAARLHSATTFFKKHNVPVEFFTLPKHPRGESAGRFEAHILAMRSALKDQDLNNLLIFDDDPELLQLPTAECVKEVGQFVALRNFDIFSLDASPEILFNVTKSVPNFHHVFQTHAQNAGAYVVSRKFMERMVKMDYDLLQASLADIYSISNNAFAVLPAWFGRALDTAESHSNIAQIRDIVRKGTTRAKGLYAANAGGMPAIFIALLIILIVFVLVIVLL